MDFRKYCTLKTSNFTILNKAKWLWPSAIIAACFMVSCSADKFLADGESILKGCEIKSEDKSFDANVLEPCMRQHPNSKWFSLFKIPLGIYEMSGSDSTKWANRMLRRLGEEPVVYDSLLTKISCNNMTSVLQSMGYLDAEVKGLSKTRRRHTNITYNVIPGHKYIIDSVAYQIEDNTLYEALDLQNVANRGLKRGMAFSTENLESERKRLATILQDKGFYKFNKDFIHYDVDSTGKDGRVDLTLRLLKYRQSNGSNETNHKRYIVGRVGYANIDNNSVPLRKHVLENNTAIKENEPFCASDLQQTYNNFSRLQAVRFTNIHFSELPDTNILDCNVQLIMHKPNSISFQPEGTNTAGDFGAAASLTYTNNNLFRGSEMFSVQLRGAFEAITGLEGYQNQNYEEYNIEAKLAFPRVIIPFLNAKFRHRQNLQSELLLSYNLQNRPEFHRRVFSSAWRYLWKNKSGNSSFRFDLIDINYVHMPWISATFKRDYLDDVSNRNAILRYNYEDLFILKTGLNFSYNNGKHAIRSNFEIGGNLLNAFSHMLGNTKNSRGQYTLFNIAYAQYVKGDFDYTRLFTIDSKNTFAMHLGLGIAYPYGNSSILPFEKRYFSGGANSVRGWNVRELGPGKFKGTDGRIDFINQTGDMKLDVNMELRTYLFWKLNGAFFVDAGNIWTLKNYADQPGGQFKFNEFYKQIAASYGIGIRLNLDYFIMRLDFGMKAVNPVYNNDREHYPIFSPDIGRDLAVHFAVGMPF